jgi:hypothetical protein
MKRASLKKLPGDAATDKGERLDLAKPLRGTYVGQGQGMDG